MCLAHFAYHINTLLDSLEHLRGVCNLGLQRQRHTVDETPPVYLVVPLVVLDELDQLKASDRRHAEGNTVGGLCAPMTVGAAARRASHWILETVQHQKYATDSMSSALPPTHWVLHVETPSAARCDAHRVC